MIEFPVRIADYLAAAYADETIAADAQRRFARLAEDMFKPHAVELSASSAGACVLERWAFLHGQHDLPENWETQLAKMDGGTAYGARVASLFAAAFEAAHPFTRVDCEVVVEHDGVPGHIDILILDVEVTTGATTALWLIEVKTTFWGRDFSGPPEYHWMQAGKYGIGLGTPGFSIFTLTPAAMKERGVARPLHHQTDYEVTPALAASVNAEYLRLDRARDDDPPAPDAREAWRCASCKFSRCSKNTNPLRDEESIPA